MSEYENCACAKNTITTDTDDKTCPATGFQKVSICVPVVVTPFAHAAKTVTKCCGEPVVVTNDMPCPGKKNGTCTFTLSQTICVEVPVEFGATAAVGDTFVECLGASADDICRDFKDKEF